MSWHEDLTEDTRRCVRSHLDPFSVGVLRLVSWRDRAEVAEETAAERAVRESRFPIPSLPVLRPEQWLLADLGFLHGHGEIVERYMPRAKCSSYALLVADNAKQLLASYPEVIEEFRHGDPTRRDWIIEHELANCYWLLVGHGSCWNRKLLDDLDEALFDNSFTIARMITGLIATVFPDRLRDSYFTCAWNFAHHLFQGILDTKWKHFIDAILDVRYPQRLPDSGITIIDYPYDLTNCECSWDDLGLVRAAYEGRDLVDDIMEIYYRSDVAPGNKFLYHLLRQYVFSDADIVYAMEKFNDAGFLSAMCYAGIDRDLREEGLSDARRFLRQHKLIPVK